LRPYWGYEAIQLASATRQNCDCCQPDGWLARDGVPQRLAILDVDVRIVTGPAHRHIDLLLIDELLTAHGIDVDDYAIDVGALGMAGEVEAQS
jgi:hypothetical protein